MALTEQQKESILALIRPTGRGLHKALSDLGLEATSQEAGELLARLRVPRTPMEEWTKAQLQEETNRMEALKAAHPDKEARADARIAEVAALLE